MAPTIIVGGVGQSNLVGRDYAEPYNTGNNTNTYNYLNGVWVSPTEDPTSEGGGNSCLITFANRFNKITGLSVGTVNMGIGGIGITYPFLPSSGYQDDYWSNENSFTYQRAKTNFLAVDHIDFLVHWGSEGDINGIEAGLITVNDFKDGVALMMSNLRRDLSNPNLIMYVVLPYRSNVVDSSGIIRDAWIDIFKEDDNIRLCADAAIYGRIDTVHVNQAGMESVGVLMAKNICNDYYSLTSPEKSFKLVNIQGDIVTPRAYHSSVEFNNRLYLVMGRKTGAVYGDVYWTSNCQKWHKQNMTHDINGKSIAPVYATGACNHNNNVYLLGGKDYSVIYKHIYKTSDMVNWERLSEPPWSARYGFAVLSFLGKIWVLGGRNASSDLNEVWWSTDGVSWHQEPNAPWAARRLYGAGIVYRNKMYVMTGYNGSNLNDVWATSDGRVWDQMTSSAEFSERRYSTITQIGNKIVLIGGYGSSHINDMWISTTGKRWYLVSNSTDLGPVAGHTTNFFNKRLLVSCGYHVGYKDDIYIGTDKLFRIK